MAGGTCHERAYLHTSNPIRDTRALGLTSTFLGVDGTIASTATIGLRLDFTKATNASTTTGAQRHRTLTRGTQRHVLRLHRLGLRLAFVDVYALNRGVGSRHHTIGRARAR